MLYLWISIYPYHVFATKYRFKGTHDGDGKVSKSALADCELKGTRSLRSLHAFKTLRKQCGFLVPSGLLGQIEEFIAAEDERVTADKVSTINCQLYWYVTSDQDM